MNKMLSRHPGGLKYISSKQLGFTTAVTAGTYFDHKNIFNPKGSNPRMKVTTYLLEWNITYLCVCAI